MGGPNSDKGTDIVVHTCEILIDRQFFAHFVRSQVTELMEGSLEDEAA